MVSPTNPYQSPGELPYVAPGHAEQYRQAPIPFAGSLTVRDAYEAVRLAQPLGNKVASRIVLCIFVLVLSYMVWLVAYTYMKGDYNSTRLAVIVFALSLIPITILVMRTIWYRWRAANLCRQGRGLYAETSGQVSAVCIESRTETAATTLQWSNFCGYRSSDRVAVLYHEYPRPVLIFARTKFRTHEEWERFLQIVAEMLPPR